MNLKRPLLQRDMRWPLLLLSMGNNCARLRCAGVGIRCRDLMSHFAISVALMMSGSSGVNLPLSSGWQVNYRNHSVGMVGIAVRLIQGAVLPTIDEGLVHTPRLRDSVEGKAVGYVTNGHQMVC